MCLDGASVRRGGCCGHAATGPREILDVELGFKCHSRKGESGFSHSLILRTHFSILVYRKSYLFILKEDLYCLYQHFANNLVWLLALKCWCYYMYSSVSLKHHHHGKLVPLSFGICSHGWSYKSNKSLTLSHYVIWWYNWWTNVRHFPWLLFVLRYYYGGRLFGFVRHHDLHFIYSRSSGERRGYGQTTDCGEIALTALSRSVCFSKSVVRRLRKVGSTVAGGGKQYGVMVGGCRVFSREDRPRNLTLLTHTPKSMMYGPRRSFRSL